MGKKNFVAGILDRKPMIILIMILLLIGGLVSYVMIPKQHFPKVIVPVAAVSVVYPGACCLIHPLTRPPEKDGSRVR